MKAKHLILGIAVLAIIIGLLVIGRLTGTTASGVWRGTEVACLVQGHQNLAYHIHSRVEIIENDVSQPIPPNIGVGGTCLAELHTHDATGTVHVESTKSDRRFTLSEFFAVWGAPLLREGVAPRVFVNRNSVSSAEEVVFSDGQVITLIYGDTAAEAGAVSDEEEHSEPRDTLE